MKIKLITIQVNKKERFEYRVCYYRWKDHNIISSRKTFKQRIREGKKMFVDRIKSQKDCSQ